MPFVRLVLVSLFVLVAPLGAGVIVVDVDGGGDFLDLQPAIDAASEGDVLLVKTSFLGGYGPAVVDGKSLTIHADGDSGSVNVASLAVRNLGPAQAVAVRRLFIGGGFTLDGPALDVADCAGAVNVEQCSIFGRFSTGLGSDEPLPGPGVRVTNSARVAFASLFVRGGVGGIGPDVTMQQGGPGLELVSGQLSLDSCTIEGGLGTSPVGGPSTPDDNSPAGDGGPGLLVSGGTVWVMGGTLRGGSGGGGFEYPGFCQPGGDGGTALRMVDPAALTWSRDVALTPGLPGAGGGGQIGPPCAPNGQPGTSQEIVAGTVAPLSAPMRGYVAPSPLREGQVGTHVFTGEPGDQILVFIGLTPGFAPLVGREGVFHLAFPTVNDAGFLFGTIPASGTREVDLAMPELGPGIDALTLYIQTAIGPPGALKIGGWSIQLGVDGSL